MTINNEEVNENASLLGDRTLAAFLSNEGKIAFSTYSYTDLAGKG